MLLGKIFERFANGSPVTVMLRGTLEYALRPQLLDQMFNETARHQYTHKLLFSTLVDLTSLVVCRIPRAAQGCVGGRPELLHHGLPVRDRRTSGLLRHSATCPDAPLASAGGEAVPRAQRHG